MPSRTRDKDSGWDRIKRNMKFLDKSTVRVGVMSKSLSKTKSSKGKQVHTLSELLVIAVANEFGTKESGGHIPARSFLRSTFDEELDAIHLFMSNQYNTFLLRSPKIALNRLGIFFTGKVQQKIRNLKTPPNALSTIRKKKSSNPLIDTGQLRQSITHEVILVRST